MTNYHYHRSDMPVPRSAAIIIAVPPLIGIASPLLYDIFGNNFAKMMRTLTD